MCASMTLVGCGKAERSSFAKTCAPTASHLGIYWPIMISESWIYVSKAVFRLFKNLCENVFTSQHVVRITTCTVNSLTSLLTSAFSTPSQIKI